MGVEIRPEGHRTIGEFRGGMLNLVCNLHLELIKKSLKGFIRIFLKFCLGEQGISLDNIFSCF
jgi:hypothetical protein